MEVTLARIIVSVVLFCLPIVVLVILSRKPDNALFLMFPIVGAVPAVIAALVLFVPIEAVLDARGLPQLKNVLVPVAGAAVIFIFIFAVGILGRNLGTILGKLASGSRAAWGSLVVWSGLGAAWGLVWRSTDWLARYVGLVHG